MGRPWCDPRREGMGRASTRPSGVYVCTRFFLSRPLPPCAAFAARRGGCLACRRHSDATLLGKLSFPPPLYIPLSSSSSSSRSYTALAGVADRPPPPLAVEGGGGLAAAAPDDPPAASASALRLRPAAPGRRRSTEPNALPANACDADAAERPRDRGGGVAAADDAADPAAARPPRARVERLRGGGESRGCTRRPPRLGPPPPRRRRRQ